MMPNVLALALLITVVVRATPLQPLHIWTSTIYTVGESIRLHVEIVMGKKKDH